ncbi:MAG: radical SAM protein [Bacillota bacterium]|nr:radical SAM protein [Bacillota bacterium]
MYFDTAEGIVYRPPSEANSFILRVTIGCSHNSCTFCNMYRQVQFRIRPMKEIVEQIKSAAAYNPNLKKVFLADGNALVLSTNKLLEIIGLLKSTFPNLASITCYGAPKDTLRKNISELIELKRAGLRMIYMGIESGNDGILTSINKGVSSEEIIMAGQLVRDSGIRLAAMVILGLGGKTHTVQHAISTGKVVSAINPSVLGVLTLTLEKDAPLAIEAEQGKFIPLSPLETVEELQQMLQHIHITRPCVFNSNHISNLLPLTGTLPRDKEILLSELKELLSLPRKVQLT